MCHHDLYGRAGGVQLCVPGLCPAELCELQVPRADSAPEFCLLLACGKCDAGCKSWYSDTVPVLR